MGFSVLTYPVPLSLDSGDVITLAYPAGKDASEFVVGGAHFAQGPYSLITAPAGFTVSFGVANIEITWGSASVPPGSAVKFQFELVDGPFINGREVAWADASNIDLDDLGLVPLASPNLTGTPTAPTATPGTNTTQISTTAFVAAAIAALINSAPGALDTLDELAAALGDDANFAASMTTALALKAPLASPTLTGTVQVTQRFDLSGHITPTAISATVDDYAPTGLATASVLRLSSDASRTVTGLTGGALGRLLLVQNVGANPIVLANQNAGSTAANRFLFGVDRTLEAERSVLLIYDATSSRWRDALTLTKALAATLRVGTDDERFVTAKSLFDAAAPVAVAYAASIALDLSTGLNFTIGALTGPLTLANPTNAKIGQSGAIRFVQDATGSRVITYGTDWEASGGAQSLTTTANAVDVLHYFVRAAGVIEYSLSRNFS
jgi:hypothetical protein